MLFAVVFVNRFIFDAHATIFRSASHLRQVPVQAAEEGILSNKGAETVFRCGPTEQLSAQEDTGNAGILEHE